jgi:hypothetical protein
MKSKLTLIAGAVLISIGMGGSAAAQSHAACDAYARDYAKQVSSGAEVIGGAAIGAGIGAVAGAIIGGNSRGAGTGALIGGGTGAVAGAATHSQRYKEAYNYAYYNCMNQRAAVPASGGGYQPWTPAWYQYCSSKYKSFNPQTGYYTTYGGQKKFCQ